MFPSEIYDSWQEKIQNLDPSSIHFETLRTTYDIPLEFRDKITEEYDRRVKRYRKLLKNKDRKMQGTFLRGNSMHAIT
jgi:hypothetical protein